MESDPGFEFREAQDMLFCSKTSRPATRPTPPPSHWVPGLFTGGKATRAEADHSHPTNSTV
jgi:hypothetical protein